MVRPGSTGDTAERRDIPDEGVDEMVRSSEPYQQLLHAYLDICNKVLAANRDRFPYRQIWTAGQEALSGRPVILSLHDDVPKAHCAVEIGEHHISAEAVQHHELHARKQSSPVHTVRLTYLLEVVAEPDKYVADPSLINWDWLRP